MGVGLSFNGCEFGIQVGGLGTRRRCRAEGVAPVPEGLPDDPQAAVPAAWMLIASAVSRRRAVVAVMTPQAKYSREVERSNL